MAVKAPPSRRGLLVALVMVPFWTNFLVRTIGWQVILSPEGWLSTLLQAIGHLEPARHPLHPHRGAARRRLQLPAAHDPAAVRRLRPGRRPAARGVERPRRGQVAHVRAGHAAARAAGRHRGRAARLHPAHGRLHHRDRARRREGQHGRPARREPVPDRAELGARLGDGGPAHPRHPAHGRGVGARARVARDAAVPRAQPARARRARRSTAVRRIAPIRRGRPAPTETDVPEAGRAAQAFVVGCRAQRVGRARLRSSCSRRSSSSSSLVQRRAACSSRGTEFGFDGFLALLAEAVRSATRCWSRSRRAPSPRSSPRCSARSPASRWRGIRASGSFWFIGLLLLVSVTPEIVDAVALLPWLVFLGQDLGLAIFNDGIVRLVDRPLAVLDRGRLVHRARPTGRARRATSRRRRPTCTRRRSRTFRRVTLPLAMPAVLAGFLLVVHAQPRQHRDRGVRPGVGLDAVARLRAERAAQRSAPRDRGGLDDHARCSRSSRSRSSRSCSGARATRRRHRTHDDRRLIALRRSIGRPAYRARLDTLLRRHSPTTYARSHPCPTPISSSPAAPSSRRTPCARARAPSP